MYASSPPAIHHMQLCLRRLSWGGLHQENRPRIGGDPWNKAPHTVVWIHEYSILGQPYIIWFEGCSADVPR